MKDLDKLKVSIEFQYGTEIKKRKDCEILADEVFERTGFMISYNTVRRFYNLAGKQSAPLSIKSLDILAKYCGFNNFRTFVGSIDNRHNKFSVYSNITLKFSLKKCVDFDIVYDIVKENSFSDQTYFFLNEALRLAFAYSDNNFLKRFFDLKPIFEDKTFLDTRLFYLIQTLGVLTREYKDKLIIWDEWAQSEFGRSFYFKFFVDMDNLMIDHFRAIETYSIYSKDGDKTFPNLLLFFYYYSRGEMTTANEFLSKTDRIDPLEIHPILSARLIIYRCLSNNKICDSNWNLVMQIQKSQEEKGDYMPYFEAWICEGLCILKEYNRVIDIFESMSSKYFEKTNHQTSGLLNRLYIYYFLSLIVKNKAEKALQIEKLISMDLLNSYSQEYDNLFYLKAKYLQVRTKLYLDKLNEKQKLLKYSFFEINS